MTGSKIIYTLTDEAPALATFSLLPIVSTFAKAAQVDVETSDISLAARILANFPENLTDKQRVPDALSELGKLVKTPEANVIKLPNISASIPQLKSAICELQDQGYKVPDFPDTPKSPEEETIRQTYAKVLGSAVNPVLREGNSDRRAPESVKKYARNNPHKMGVWKQSSQTHVAHMRGGDFYSGEQSTIIDQACDIRIEFENKKGEVTVLRNSIPLQDGEVIDGMFMSVKALRSFFAEQMEEAKESGLLYSLHVKATMMKVSHPIVFGHAVTVYFKDLWDKHGDLFEELGVNPNNGFSHVHQKIETLPYTKRAEIEADIRKCYTNGPELAMVNSDKGISNLHVPSDVIVDASMPAMIREGGKMWGTDGKLKETKALIPESTYATIYQEVINFCKHHGAFDPTSMGTSPNVGLMAQKAEEYGSHDKTFEMVSDGTMRILKNGTNEVLIKHEVEKGDIWRMCQAKDEPIQDWVKLAVKRARLSGMPALFWLDDNRPHDKSMITKVETYLKDHDTEGLNIQIMSPDRAIRYTMERIIRGKDTISVTGNVLRDYLTDLFPILELGTSAKMLSIVPLMQGGGMFETGAGGSAPKHVQQFIEEGHLRWDSLGEFMALAVSLEDIAEKTGNDKAKVLGDALDQATSELLTNNKSPARKVGEPDNRTSHFYLALYWARALAEQNTDGELKESFTKLAESLGEYEPKIIEELLKAQHQHVDLGGYYNLDPVKITASMRPSDTFNRILKEF
ncbi:MAG: isocitrate dehydrogenase (NADP(+)) [Zetaproteobacteria bacterium]|nr:isocitrate dehydrogenase (NADP(+)) [Pseudobdellovibrionaceae bacterium]